jgi:hypothetical protein
MELLGRVSATTLSTMGTTPAHNQVWQICFKSNSDSTIHTNIHARSVTAKANKILLPNQENPNFEKLCSTTAKIFSAVPVIQEVQRQGRFW